MLIKAITISSTAIILAAVSVAPAMAAKSKARAVAAKQSFAQVTQTDSRARFRAPIYDPENARDPDPRIGGSFKMNSSGND